VIESPLVRHLPPPATVHRRLGQALREVQLLRGLLRLSQRAAEYRRTGRRRSRKGGEQRGVSDGC
jgi:hypothetical protein